MSNRTQLSSDPFGRTTLMRETVPQEDRRSCTWCGNRPGRFRYGREGDGSYRFCMLKGAFCCKGCACAYHEGEV